MSPVSYFAGVATTRLGVLCFALGTVAWSANAAAAVPDLGGVGPLLAEWTSAKPEAMLTAVDRAVTPGWRTVGTETSRGRTATRYERGTGPVAELLVGHADRTHYCWACACVGPLRRRACGSCRCG